MVLTHHGTKKWQQAKKNQRTQDWSKTWRTMPLTKGRKNHYRTKENGNIDTILIVREMEQNTRRVLIATIQGFSKAVVERKSNETV